jgi:tRNA1(Val) A37 N6-methylase TrmN6
MEKLHMHDLLAYDGLKIFQRDDLFKFSIDALLLGDFVQINPTAKKIIDLGCGLGAVSLYLSLKTNAEIVGIDIQKDVIDLANKSIAYNQLDTKIRCYQRDIKHAYKDFETNQFDVVVCNPPFYKSNEVKQQNDLESLSLSRHEVSLNLNDLFLATKRLLSNGGKFYFIHRVERMDEIIIELNKHNFVAKRMRFVYTKPGKPAKMLLVEARHNGSMGSLEIQEPLYIYNENNDYTDEILKIFHLGDDQFEITATL